MTDETTQDGQNEPSMEDTIAETLRAIQQRESSVEEEIGGSAATPSGDAQLEQSEPATLEGIPDQGLPLQQDVEPIKPPSGWRKEALSKWETLDPEVRDEVLRREADFHKGIEGYKQRASFADEVNAAIQPYMATIQSIGATPVKAIQDLLSSDHVLRYGTHDQKMQMVQQLAQSYGIDLNQVPTYEQPYVDPQLQALQQQIGQLQSVLSQQQTRDQQAEQQTLMAEIDAFKADPAHGHFEALKTEMGALLSAGIAQNLQDAYDRALWARPDLRQSLLAQQRAEADRQRREQVNQARKAAAVNTPRAGKPASGAATPPANMDDDLRQQVARLKEQGYSF